MAVKGRAGPSPDELDRAHVDPWIGTAEEPYRRWSLAERLFLNPLNDLGLAATGARDVLHLPTMRVSAEIGSGFHGFFNQLKQELAAARFLAFEAVHERDGRHEADNDVGLLETWNDTVFGLGVEKLKLALRAAYSLLDKIAVFIGLYFDLQVEPHHLNIRSVWYENPRRKNGLNRLFEGKRNWPLRGLYWLSLDIDVRDGEFHEATEPGARDLATLRNRLEHQYVRVVETSVIRRHDEPGHIPPDSLAYEVTKADLATKTLHVLRTARAALIYLSLAVSVEETNKERADGPGTFTGQFPRRT